MNPIYQATEKSIETVNKALTLIAEQSISNLDNTVPKLALVRDQLKELGVWSRIDEYTTLPSNNFALASKEQQLLRMHYGNHKINRAYYRFKKENEISSDTRNDLIEASNFYNGYKTQYGHVKTTAGRYFYQYSIPILLSELPNMKSDDKQKNDLITELSRMAQGTSLHVEAHHERDLDPSTVLMCDLSLIGFKKAKQEILQPSPCPDKTRNFIYAAVDFAHHGINKPWEPIEVGGKPIDENNPCEKGTELMKNRDDLIRVTNEIILEYAIGAYKPK